MRIFACILEIRSYTNELAAAARLVENADLMPEAQR
jgi:hypothetical protein